MVFNFFKFSFKFLTAVHSSYPLKAKHTLYSVCGLRRSYPNSFSALRALSIAEIHHPVFRVQAARVKSAGSRKIPRFFLLIKNYTAPANRKKTLPSVREYGMFFFKVVRT